MFYCVHLNHIFCKAAEFTPDITASFGLFLRFSDNWWLLGATNVDWSALYHIHNIAVLEMSQKRKNRLIIRLEKRVCRLKYWNMAGFKCHCPYKIRILTTKHKAGNFNVNKTTVNISLPSEDPLSCGHSHEHQQQPEASHLVCASGPLWGHNCVRHRFL